MSGNNKTVFIRMPKADQGESSLEALDAAYRELGKAFYENRFEEPTPELILYFDQITHLKEQLKLRDRHTETMDLPKPEPAASTGGIFDQLRSIDLDSLDNLESLDSLDGLESLSPCEDLDSRNKTGNGDSNRSDPFEQPMTFKYCPFCGTKLPLDARFCGNCGESCEE
ncbi:zinc ribbon domain-containing protein [uncultured Allobaculum sp.]|uniref:zinc ribbon domain-containing protein n=3 Tax=Allobaculum TaxID=174708 RepID=UPI002595D9E2|nr:zinc ribbon domain-containing protein [uncultured Allobaculum sp.]